MYIAKDTVSKNMINSDLRHRVHRHAVIKNEDYHAREGDVCYGCGSLLSGSLVVYHCTYFGTSAEEDDCAHFFIHKTCADSPTQLRHPSHQHRVELFECPQSHVSRDNCDVCGIKLKGFTYYCYRAGENEFQMCLACAIPRNKIEIHPPYHRHKLTFVASQAIFQCDVCHMHDLPDFSYMCSTCPFWIHLYCSNLPRSLVSDIYHKHPLRLAYSLPEKYRRFQQSCRICRQELGDPSDWIYHCPDCRFFAHITCATSPPPYYFRGYTNYTNQEDLIHESLSDHVHLPLPEDESLLRHCIKKGSISWLKDAAALIPPDHIKHWSHEHQLLLKNQSVMSTTFGEEILPICNGCTESITIKDGAFYECRESDYILHRYCAHFPKEMSDPGGLGRELVAVQPSVHDTWSCSRCKRFRNGTQLQCTYALDWQKTSTVTANLDSGCAVLPKRITHKAHQHTSHPYGFRLVKCSAIGDSFHCSACGQKLNLLDANYFCDEVREGPWEGTCPTYLDIECALKPLRMTHRWDPHPLHLTTSVEEVTDHPHEFHCEFCSEEINTNYWFYHCSVCDLSFHLKGCTDLFPYSKVKFGATNIMLDAHQHGLTFVLNKRKHQPCHRCHKDTIGKPVLKCTPCKFVQHAQPELCSLC